MTLPSELASDVVRTEDVIGVTVKNPQLEDLGKVEEIVLDKVKGNVRYVVLSFGGILGLGDKLFALPWKSLNYNEDEDCFIVSIDQEKLKKAPGFDKNNWPDFADNEWGKSIYNYYGVKPYWD